MYIDIPEVNQWVMLEGADNSPKLSDLRSSIACRGYFGLVGGVCREFTSCLGVETPTLPSLLCLLLLVTPEMEFPDASPYLRLGGGVLLD